MATPATTRTDIALILTVITGHTARTVTIHRPRIITGAKSTTATIATITATNGGVS